MFKLVTVRQFSTSPFAYNVLVVVRQGACYECFRKNGVGIGYNLVAWAGKALLPDES
jgi:hypothetical protein